MSQRYSFCLPKVILARKIQPGEEILWEGRPVKRHSPFHYVQCVLKECALLFFFFMMILMAIACLLSYFEEPPPPQPSRLFSYVIYPALLLLGTIGALVFTTFALIFLFYAMALLFSPALKRRHRDLYVLTNRRLIALLADESPLARGYGIYSYSLHKIKYRRDGTGNVILQYGKREIFEFNDITDAGNARDILKWLKKSPSFPVTGKLN